MFQSVALDAALPLARAAVAAFLQALNPDQRVVVFCHFDADGLAAGALLQRGLRRMGYADVAVLVAHRGESAYSDHARQRIAAAEPAALIVTDLGVNAAGILPGLPTLLIDHHQPAGVPTDVVVVSGYTWQPIPTSAWLAYEVLAPLVDMEDLAWIAAVGTLSDLGDAAPWAALPAIKKRYTAKWLKEAVALINAARRSSAFDVQTPLDLLLHAEHPKQISTDDEHGAYKLHEYRAEVTAELRQARKQPPIFSADQPFALIQIDSTCQIHPLIAQQWRGRLPRYAVIAANHGYLPDVIAFSIRTARTDLSLPQMLQAIEMDAEYPAFGFGHDQASGGHLPPHAFNHLMTALGFDERAQVD